jgi:putative transposase
MMLRIQVRKLFKDSRGSAGSRTLIGQLHDLGYPVGRFKVRRLMVEANLVSSQPGHKYKKAGQARVGIPNLLERQFSVAQPNQVWCGDIT